MMNAPSPTPPTALPLVTDEAWPAEVADLKGGFASRLNVYRTMAHNPELLRAWAPLRDHVVLKGRLSDAQREIVILRVGLRWRAAYEWAHHVSRGRLAGLDEARIARAGAPLDFEPSADDEDGLLIAAVDALIVHGRLAQPLLQALGATLPKAAILDLMALVGFYSTLAFIAKTFDVPIEPDLAALAPTWPTE